MTSPRARAQAPIRTVIAGVDAHKDTHHVVVLTGLGQRLADRAFPATIAGYADLRDRVGSHGPIRCFAMESTGSYSAALTRYLIGTGADVVEVNRPHPRTRSRVGKDDAIDAEAAARKALSGQCTARPKDTTTAVESIRVDCWMFFGQCLFVLQAAFVKSRKSLSTSSGVRYPRAE